MDNLMLNEYQKQTKATAIYPPEIDVPEFAEPGVYRQLPNIFYTVLGLCSEVGEVVALMDSISNESNIIPDMVKEQGDVMWYLAQIAELTGFQLGDLDWKDAERERDNEEFIDHWDPFREGAGTAMVVASAELAGIAKKILRGDRSIEDYAEEIRGKVAYILSWVSFWAVALETTLQKICDTNIAKLASRKERGVLQGSGDHR